VSATQGEGPRPREVWLLVLGSVALAVIVTWPLAIHPGHRIAQNLADPIRTAWQVAWTGHALAHQPLHVWQSNAFWPLGNSLAFSDSLLGYAPFGLAGSGQTAALVRYNLLFLLAYALPLIGAYLLGRELGLRPAAAAVAGLAFAYAPARSEFNSHLHVISSGAIPLSLFLLVRGYRRQRPGIVFAGWAVAAWQLSLGFTLGLQLAYLLAVVAIVVGVLWWRRERRALPRPVLLASVAGVALFAVVGAFQARPYLQVADRYEGARRSEAQVQRYSASPRAYLSASPENRLWAGATAGIRDDLREPKETSLFPGLAIVLLAGVGVVAGTAFSRRLRAGLAIGVLVCAVCALGFGLANGWLGYRWLFKFAPGWGGVRTPGRIVTLVTLGLALLAGAGAQRLMARDRRAAVALAAVLPALVLAEGVFSLDQPRVPRAPAALAGLDGPQIHLPIGPYDRLYQFWSVEGFPKIANGVSTIGLPPLERLRDQMEDFPDRRSVRALRKLGIRTVVLHTGDRVHALPPSSEPPRPPDPDQAADRDAGNLGLTREDADDDVVIYRIRDSAVP
jgi:hypothetical protein